MNGTDQDIGRLLAMTEEQGKQLSLLFAKLDQWQGDGCPTGKRLSSQVESIRKHMESLKVRVIVLGVLVAAGGHGLGAIIKSLLK